MQASTRLSVRYAADSDIGRVRANNEDSAYAGPWLLAVADGMGGHAGGEVASSVAIRSLASTDAAVPAAELTGTLQRAVARANEAIAAGVRARPALAGMGTTLTAMLWCGTTAALAHIGDSRAYLLRDGELRLLTEDHTLERLLADTTGGGPVPHGSRLTRVLDGRAGRIPDLTEVLAHPGDRYLLCSDGLSGPVEPGEIHTVLSTAGRPDGAVARLIEAANRAGGPDNVTAIVADVIGEQTRPQHVVITGAAGCG